jgi:hypothetical protein
MAKSGDTGGGDSGNWPGFLSELTKNFLILRDLFGYALPGAVFLAIGLFCRRFSLHDVQYFFEPYKVPAWLGLILGLVACYTAGHVMAQLAYLPDNWKTWRRIRNAKAAAKDKNKAASAEKAEYKCLAPVLIEIRESHPALLTEYDRQSTISQFRGGVAAAMLLGSVVFYLIPVAPPIGVLVGIAGAFQIVVFWLTGTPHIEDLKCDTITAGETVLNADKTPAPAHSKNQPH